MTEQQAIELIQQYVGTPYEAGVFDCWDLTARVLREVFGRRAALPADRSRPAGVAGQRREIFALRDQVAVRVHVPFTGCGVLLSEPHDGGQQWHIGVGAQISGETWVLHNSARLGSAHFHRLSDLLRWGMRLDDQGGFFAWK